MKELIINLDHTLIDTTALDDAVGRGGSNEIIDVVDQCKPYSGVEKVLHRIKHNKIPVCVISRANEFLSKSILSHCGIPYVKLLFYDGKTVDSYESALRAALAFLEIKPEYALSICSNAIDITASNHLGIQSVGCLWGPQLNEKSLAQIAKSTALVPGDLTPLFFSEAFEGGDEDSYDECESIYERDRTGTVDDIYTDSAFYRNWFEKQRRFTTLCHNAAKDSLSGWTLKQVDIDWNNNPNIDAVNLSIPHFIASQGHLDETVHRRVLQWIKDGKPRFPTKFYDQVAAFIQSVKENYYTISDDTDELMVFFADSDLDKTVTEKQFDYLSDKLSKQGIKAKIYNKMPYSVPEKASYIIIELVSNPDTVRSVCNSAIEIKEGCHKTCYKKALGVGCYTNLVYLTLAWFEESLKKENMTNTLDQSTVIQEKTIGEASRISHDSFSIEDFDEIVNETVPEGQEAGDNAFSVDGIKLDPDNQEFQYALQFALESNRNLYLTGKAGSGKTTFLKYLRKVTKKNMAVVAPTGVAAVNAGGQTIHSFFKIKPSLYVPNDKRLRTYAPENEADRSTIFDNFRYRKDQISILRNLELLVIDEVSMVRADLLDVVDTLLRVYRKSNLPFGGVQVILIGDTFQLPPVVVGEDKDLLRRFYDSEFFFSAKVIQQNKPLYIELKKIYRQNEQDFIDLLNRVRVNKMLPGDFQTLNHRLNPSFKPKKEDNYIILATKNDRVSAINEGKLNELHTSLMTYEAEITGDFPLSNRPTDTELQLKVGAQVMFVKNDSEGRYYNGKIGVLTEANNDEVKVEIETEHGARKTIAVRRETWKNMAYTWNEEEGRIEEEVIGTFTQIPLRLAWAITVHKSQGLTFEKVIADIGDSFASGQVYVALSRCTSLNGLVLTSPIGAWSVKTDRRVIDFAKNETPETLLTEQLSSSKADYYYSEARKAFRAHNVTGMLDYFYTALKYRNDVNTDIFRRYVSTWTERLFGVFSSEKKLREQILEKEKSINEYKEKVASLETQLNIKDAEISAKADQLRILRGDVTKAENQITKLKRDNKAANDEIAEANKVHQSDIDKIAEMQKRIERQDKILRERHEKVLELSAEVERVQNIKWYEKLFGKK